MPKVARTEEAEQAARIKSAIIAQMTYYGLKPEKVAKGINLSVQSFYNRLNNPLMFRRCEEIALNKMLHFTPEQKEAFKI